MVRILGSGLRVQDLGSKEDVLVLWIMGWDSASQNVRQATPFGSTKKHSQLRVASCQTGIGCRQRTFDHPRLAEEGRRKKR